MYLAKIRVTLKASVLDPQGSTVSQSLHALGYDEVRDIRIGKYMEVTLDSADQQVAEERVREMCEKLLVNTVIETYSFELLEV